MSVSRIALAVLAFSLPVVGAAQDEVEIAQAMDTAVTQLISSQLGDGLYQYDVDLRSGQSTPPGQLGGMALVRQSLAAFALSRYNRRNNDPAVRNSVRMALIALSERSLPISKGSIQTALEHLGLMNRWRLWRSLRVPLQRLGWLYDTEGTGAIVSADGRYDQTYTGATAFALATGLLYRAESGDKAFDDWLQRWAHGLAALRVHGRGVRESAGHLTESHYVNGQSWLALINYNNVFPDDVAAAGALSGLEAYIYERYSRYNPGFFHWGNMAAAERVLVSNDLRWLEFLRKSVIQFLSEEPQRLDSNENKCHLLEGLASYMTAEASQAGQDNSRESMAFTAIRNALPRTLLLQVDHEIASRIPQPIDTVTTKAWNGAFILSIDTPLARADLTGHCLNTFVYLQALPGDIR